MQVDEFVMDLNRKYPGLVSELEFIATELLLFEKFTVKKLKEVRRLIMQATNLPDESVVLNYALEDRTFTLKVALTSNKRTDTFWLTIAPGQEPIAK